MEAARELTAGDSGHSFMVLEQPGWEEKCWNQHGRQGADSGLPAGEEKLQVLGARTVPEAFKSLCSSTSDLN